MFTGIIETLGNVCRIGQSGTNQVFWIESSLAGELHPDQSIAHDGVCLTVEEIKDNSYRVTAVAETLSKTTLSNWETGTLVNLERCLQLPARLDGHLVQGHVDTTGICESVREEQGSWVYRFRYSSGFGGLVVEKGSIALNGISLTVFDLHDETFSVAIIPYTYEHTNLHRIQTGQKVNLEFDILGKYVQRNLRLRPGP